LALVVAIFGALRLYGAYQTEKEAALTRAADAAKKADRLEAEGRRLERQSECNGLWQEYETALLKKRLAELRGQFVAAPAEPSCTGYAPKLDVAMEQILKAAELTMEAASVRTMPITNETMPSTGDSKRVTSAFAFGHL
jgi:hypothetical protein